MRATSGFLVPPAFSKDPKFNETPVGTGPYRLVERLPDRLTFEAFDGYWIPRNWSKEGPIKTQSRIDRPKRRDELPGPVRFMFQPGEEGHGGADVMVGEGVLDGVDRAFAIHISPNIPNGYVSCRPGPIISITTVPAAETRNSWITSSTFLASASASSPSPSGVPRQVPARDLSSSKAAWASMPPA